MFRREYGMFENFFLKKKENGGVESGENKNELDEEFQIPSLHRGNYVMTAELLRRREEETMRKQYQLSTSKTGWFL